MEMNMLAYSVVTRFLWVRMKILLNFIHVKIQSRHVSSKNTIVRFKRVKQRFLYLANIAKAK